MGHPNRRVVRGLRRIPAAFALVLSVAAMAGDGALHVPSPDWRDQVVYFLMTDRFDDGDADNNDQGAGEYDPADSRKYSGGDLAGVSRRLDYIQGLGATALWLTPPVANQWWDGRAGYGGYHGYWAEHFMEVDRHLGTLADYQALSRALHRRGMYLVQDVVVNHVGNFFGYGDAWREDDPVAGYRRNDDSVPVRAPQQAPFDRNDPRDPAQRAQGIYHWTPAIADYADREQELTFQLADLDDLNTGTAAVRSALRRSYGWWIEQAGVDAFRVDTAFHVPPDFFDDFLLADDAEAPGVLRVAEATGRDGFHVFGEGLGIDRPHDEAMARKIETYMHDADGRPRLPGMLNFPLYGSLQDVFARGAPTAVLGHRIASMVRRHPRLRWMPSFVDNHDLDRFLAGGSEAGLKQALLAIFTLPGVPVIYYGTEQGFAQRRQAMFADGWGADGRDHFDTEAPLYRYLRTLADLRREHPLFSRGTPVVLRDQAATPGALAWRMDHAGGSALVVFNSADHRVLLDALDTGLAPGTRLRARFAIEGEAGDHVVGQGGRLDLVLPPRGGMVWLVGERGEPPSRSRARVRLDRLAGKRVAGDLEASGRARGDDNVLLVIDGDLDRAQAVQVDERGGWRARIDTAALAAEGAEHRLVAWSPDTGSASPARRFHVERRWRTLVDIDDPAGDDTGPDGRYRYPTDPGWGEHRQLDLLGARVESADGGALRLGLRMRSITAPWNPPNGFDHVAFTIHISLPGRDGGVDVLPLQNARMPDGLRWHYRLRVGGWSNALFSAEGADASNEGTSVSPGAAIHVDRATGTLVLTLPGTVLGRPESWSGARIHVSTWDQDGSYRPLTPEPTAFGFGGGDGARDPLIMDALLIELP